MRNKTNYYDALDTCPTYSPNSPDDPYPGQPIQDLQLKYPNNGHTYPYHSVVQHANRRQEDNTIPVESFKSTETVCRLYQREDESKDAKVRCDKNIEMRDAPYTMAKAVPVEALDPCDRDPDLCL